MFPGIRYGADCPLLYYAALKYKRMEYKAISVDYGKTSSDGADLGGYAAEALKNVKTSLGDFDFSAYEDVIFASKSIGTAIALSLEDALNLKNVSHILLTPVRLTLPLMEKPRRYKCIISSDADPYINADELKALAKRRALPLTVFEGLNHRLENEKGAEENIEILLRAAKLF